LRSSSSSHAARCSEVNIQKQAGSGSGWPRSRRQRCHSSRSPSAASGVGSAATVSEATQNQICAYLSIALLVGLLANALAGWWWADPLAALGIAAVAAKEGRQSWRGEGCCDAC
jgi:hypothetical protein